MLLLRSISQSCVNSLHDSLTILTRRRFEFEIKKKQIDKFLVSIRTPNNELLPVVAPSTPSPQSSIAIINTSNRPLSQSLNNSTSGKSSLTVGLSSQSNLFNSQSRTSRYSKYFTSNHFFFCL